MSLDALRTLTVEEAAEALKVRPATVRSWIREGRLPAFRGGRVLRIPASALAPDRRDEAAERARAFCEGLDVRPGRAHTAAVEGEAEPMPLYIVRKYRRRDLGGKWVLWWRESPGPPAPGQKKIRKVIGRLSARRAEQHREAWQAELNGLRPGAEGGGAIRWADFCRLYLATVADLAGGTVALYRQTLARVGRLLHPRRLAEVDRMATEQYRAARLVEVGHETVRKDLRHLQAAWSWAAEQGLIDFNPWIEGRRRGRRERYDPDALSTGDTARFLAALEGRPTWQWTSLRLACLWGPRTGELARLERKDLDLAGRTLRIPSRPGRQTPKGGRGRTMPLDDATAGLLQELSHRAGPILWGPEHRSADGKAGYRRVLVKAANQILESLGLPARLAPVQMLRRTAETNMRRRGVPDWMIGRILGHGTRVGEQFYAGLGPEEIANQVASIMRAGPSPGTRGGQDENRSFG